MTATPHSDVVVALTTCPNAEVAERIANVLVTERLAACVNQLAGIRSTYIWKGQLQTDAEVLLLIKTTTAQLATVETRLQALHPYDLPEFIAIPVCAGSQSYLNWVRQNIGPIDQVG